MKLDLMSEIHSGPIVAGGTKAVDRPSGSPVGAGKASSKSTGSAAAGSTGVTVTLSPQSQSLNGTSASAETYDADKVESVKAAIANGSLQVNAEAIADKLLANASEMLSAYRR